MKEAVREKALSLGFDVCGFALADADPDDAANLRRYLAEGRHGDMAWMERTAERRASPTALWPEARSVICLGVNYGPEGDPLAVHADADRGAISVYARGRDYHKVLKSRLKALGRWLVEAYGGDAKIFVDTAPVMEKPLAQRAGLGWIGKHTNLVSRRFSSWLFLGEVFTTLQIAPDAPEIDHCGSCDACLRACPTGALPEPYRIEPRRCLSYLTIEHAGEIPEALTAAAGNRIYGCDDCLAVCPWTKFSSPTPHEDLKPRPELVAPDLKSLAALDDEAFARMFSGTAIKRIGRERLTRNVRVGLDNAAAGRRPKPAT
ncbi:MAG TPA: tRNA epoxyqueuosine(34) reductase QueG [Rhodospirillales bacterium]|mgnify:CR=1 FL=1|jgi:epoxyqueuosine reductase|nr:tRNA epoxyqueuosine(34) reductase QueG [Rhodospirillales bacterium]